MYLYSSIIQPSQNALNCTTGRFTVEQTEEDNNYEEIAVNYGNLITIYSQIHSEEDTVREIASSNAYSHIFNISSLLLAESKHSLLVVTSDSGNIVIIDLLGRIFNTIVSLPFARTGLRRIEPGYYLSVSPCGRAIFTSAIEKYKLAWKVSKGDNDKAVLSAPLENAKNDTFVYAVTSLDVGYEYPKFCCIEVRRHQHFSEIEQSFNPKTAPKILSFYQLDTSINYLIKYGRPDQEILLPHSSYSLIPVPGPLFDAPGGVIVPSDGQIQYFNSEGVLVDTLKLPHRADTESIIISNAVFKSDNGWFILLQNQFGDLLFVNIPEDHMQVQYFDTIPVASSMCILSQGTLALFGSSGVNKFYFISEIPEPLDSSEIEESLVFHPSEELTRITEFDEHKTMTRLTKMITRNSQSSFQLGDIITIHGSEQNSSLKVTKRGVPTRNIINITTGGTPTFVKTIKKDPIDAYDKYIFLSYTDKTRVFEFNQDTRRLSDYGGNEFIYNSPTLEVFLMPSFQISSICQIHAGGIHIVEQNGEIHNWSRPGNSVITHSSANTNQISVCFDDGVITLFETDQQALPYEVSSFKIKEINGEIVAMALPQTSDGIKTCDWLAVATFDGNVTTVIIVNIKKSKEQWSISSRIVINDLVSDMEFLSFGVNQILHIGHNNGILTRVFLDNVTGSLSNSQVNLLSRYPVYFSKCIVNGVRTLMINSLCPWIADGMKLTQFSTQQFILSCQYNAPFFPDGGFIGLTTDSMILFYTPNTNSIINTQTIPINETPRQIVMIPDTTSVCLLTSDIVSGTWKSAARVIDTESQESSEILHFDEGLMVTSAAFINGLNVVAVCLAKNLRFNPRSSDGGFIALLDISTNPPSIVQLSDFKEEPTAIAPHENYILAGMGQELMVLKVGKSRLLKKSCSRSFPHCITFIKAFGNRIIVGDSSESFHFVKFDEEESILSIFADDITPRFPLCSLCLDRMTVACGDRFGNFTILRLPIDISDEAEIDPSSIGHTFEHPLFAGAKNKLEILANIHMGAPITSLDFSASKQSIVYATVNGEIGVFVPLSTDTEASLIRKLEIEMINNTNSIVGRNIELFRSYYSPKKNISDGSVVSRFLYLPESKQREIAEKLKVTIFDITRLITKLEYVF